MKYEVTITLYVDSPFDLDTVHYQMESVFEFGTVREAIAEGLHLGPDPSVLEIAVKPVTRRVSRVRFPKVRKPAAA